MPWCAWLSLRSWVFLVPYACNSLSESLWSSLGHQLQHQREPSRLRNAAPGHQYKLMCSVYQTGQQPLFRGQTDQVQVLVLSFLAGQVSSPVRAYLIIGHKAAASQG